MPKKNEQRPVKGRRFLLAFLIMFLYAILFWGALLIYSDKPIFKGLGFALLILIGWVGIEFIEGGFLPKRGNLDDRKKE